MNKPTKSTSDKSTMTASEKFTTILVKPRTSSGENMEALKVFLAVVAFIGSFAFGTLGRYESPAEDDALSTSVPVLLSLFFLSGATTILLYIAVVGTVMVACHHRILNLDNQFRVYVFQKMRDKMETQENVEFSQEDWSRNQKDWQIHDTYGNHLVTYKSTNGEKAEEEIRKIVQESVREIFQEEEKHYNVLMVNALVNLRKLEDIRTFIEHRGLVKEWKKNGGKKRKEPILLFKENSQFSELSKVNQLNRRPGCVYYPHPLWMFSKLFWGLHIRGPIRCFPLAIVFLMAGQALDICASENSGIVEIVILAVWFVPFSFLVYVVSNIGISSILMR